MGCQSPQCPAGEGYDGAHYLLSWYYAWGGSHLEGGRLVLAHRLEHGPQRVPESLRRLGAGATTRPSSRCRRTAPATGPRASTGSSRCTAGCSPPRGVSRAAPPTAGAAATRSSRPACPTFYKLAYVEAPVYVDPPSNNWFGFQAWSMDRVAQLYYVTGNEHAKVVLDRWVKWVLANVHLDQGRRLRDSVGPRVVGRSRSSTGTTRRRTGTARTRASTRPCT